jgi:lipopolysaccharide transport system ATP-binding protein
MSDVAIRCKGLGKLFRKGFERGGKLLAWLRPGKGYEYFWALKDATFEVKKGEMLGIIGHNGAGKSTLLRILSRITRPNEGCAEIRGRVGTLLDVGTGFHDELTGRENIYLNGTLIGMTRSEMRSKFDEIVDFSGIAEFLDTPIKRYSSGMKVRLGFSVAANLQQEIMLVDEVLSVGDAAFRIKCMDKMDHITRGGNTVLFVGHNMEMINASCDRVIWLDHGRIVAQGKAPEIVDLYLEQATAKKKDFSGFISLTDTPDSKKNDTLRLTHIRLLSQDDHQIPCFKSGQRVKLAIGYLCRDGSRLSGVSLGITIFSNAQIALAHCENTCAGTTFDNLPLAGEFVCELEKLPMVPGRYRLGLKCKIGDEQTHSIPNAGHLEVVEGDFYPTGALPPPGSGHSLVEHRWYVNPSKRQS